ncbi:hypothetical protein Y695_03282 [Hydrogenophaga sp. T4]|nr:hypothetical protein Y695_03282 [Hydrogenophaga sp. T4]
MVTVLQHGGGRRLDAHLVFDAHAMHVVARAQRAVFVHHELRHHEQADALHALGRSGHAGEHEVHDVLGHVVLTVGDEDLGAKDLVGAVGLRLGAAAHGGQIGAGLRLGQVHGAGPFAAHQLLQIDGFELVAARGDQRLDGAIGQQRAEREAHVGAVEDFTAGRTDGLGQALTAEVHRVLQALPAAFGVLFESFLETGRRGDLAVMEGRRVLVALPVQRRDHPLVELGALLQHGLRGVQASVFKTGQRGHLVDARQVFDVEQHVFEGCDVTHSNVSRGSSGSTDTTRASRTMPLPVMRCLQRLDQLGHGGEQIGLQP